MDLVLVSTYGVDLNIKSDKHSDSDSATESWTTRILVIHGCILN